MPWSAESERLRRKILSPWGFRAYLWWKIPLGAFAGMRIAELDESHCRVDLPGGWRTQNPFRSTYFAAQAMAAELSTGAPAMLLTQGQEASVAMLVREVRATYSKKIQGPSRYTFSDVAALREVVLRAARSGESESFAARSVATTADGTEASVFEITWSFKRRQG